MYRYTPTLLKAEIHVICFDRKFELVLYLTPLIRVSFQISSKRGKKFEILFTSKLGSYLELIYEKKPKPKALSSFTIDS
jgi:hypothetical protein